jgi:hypothetical protein
MATSLIARAERRASEVQAAIRALLADGSSGPALNCAIQSLQSEASKLRRWRAADGALTDAEMAGYLTAVAAALRDHKPPRPEGCPRVPRPADLIAVFDAEFQRAAEGGQA